MATSSSSSVLMKKYDVFLSFRGEDTRDNFTSHLFTTLERKKVVTYIDYQLVRGEKISCGLLKAIEESKLWIIIFSQNYASSSWCLDELLHILDCDCRSGRVIPVFYRIDPSCVRKQRGSYGDALDDLRKRYDADSVAKWKDALTTAANLSGWSTQDSRTESELVEKIVGDIMRKLSKMAPHIAFEGLVGVHQPIRQIESLLHTGSVDVRIIGIWGLAGIGKTTLAQAIFDKLAHQFEAYFFLENVREKWEKCREECRNQFYSELLEETDAIGWSTYHKVRLSRKRVLIVLDDVNDQEQLEYFVGSPNYLVGPGSRIIVTSRDRQSFGNRVSAIYKVEGLEYDEAHQLFRLNAFKGSSHIPHSKELLEKVVKYAEGIPLAIKVLASLFGSKSKEQWGSLLAQQKASPDKKIQKILQISYEGLNENQQSIFLDIACFFKGCDRHYVQEILYGCGFFPDIGIDDLVDKSLITINSHNKLGMHDLVQRMGWEIIRLESPKEPGRRSRLWTAQDIYHVLKYDNATAMIEGIFLDMSEIKEVDLSPHVFRNTHSLRLLKISSSRHTVKKCRVNLPQDLHCLPDALRYLFWDKYPSKSLPSDFSPENLVELSMSGSQVERLWHGVQDLPKLKFIDLSFSMNLIEMPDLSQAPNLEVLTLFGCRNIINIPKIENVANLDLSHTAIEDLPGSIVSSQNLCYLKLDDCKSLKNIPSNIFQSESLKFLSLSGCSSLKKIPDFPRLLEDSELNETRFVGKMHISMESFEEHEELKEEGSKSLKIGICQLNSLLDLGLSGCSSLEKIPDLPRTLAQLDLSQTTIEEVPSSIELLTDLEFLHLRNCKRLRSLPTSICKLQSLAFLELQGCSKFDSFPEILEPMKRLFYLNLSETGIRDLPSSIENLVSLKKLFLRFCSNLKFIPSSIYKLHGLKWLDLSGFSNILKCHYPIVGHLGNLEQLELSDCDMYEIPDNLLCSLHSIPRFYPCGKGVDTAGIEFHTLDGFCISDCKNLRSLPELPFGLDYLDAQGCTSLENVSRSSTAILRGALHRDQRVSFFGDCVLFLNCLKLSQNARSNIIADAQLRILRMATEVLQRLSKEWVEYYIENASICYPGNEVPEWYNYQAMGSSINIIPPQDWLDSKFLGFSLCFVAAFKEHNYSIQELSFECAVHLKTDTHESLESKYILRANDRRMVDRNKTTIVNSDHVFLMYEHKLFKTCKAVEGTITEVSFHFNPVYVEYIDGDITPIDSSQVKRCGIRLLYREEADQNSVSNPDYWKSIDDQYRPRSEEIAKPSGSDLVLDYARETEEDERPRRNEIVQEFGSTGDDNVGETTAKEDDVVNNSSASRSEIVQEFGSTGDDNVGETTAKEDDFVNNSSASRSEIVQEFGSAADDYVGETTAKEDDVINNTSASSGSSDLYKFEAKDNKDESKSSISFGCLMFLSHIREHVLQWIFSNAVFKGVRDSSSTSEVASSL